MAKPLSDYVVTETPYPARTNTSTTTIKGADTTATCVYFSDKILITVTQNGRLGHWVSYPFQYCPLNICHFKSLQPQSNVCF
jgi:proteasome assembly chaperone 3